LQEAATTIASRRRPSVSRRDTMVFISVAAARPGRAVSLSLSLSGFVPARITRNSLSALFQRAAEKRKS